MSEKELPEEGREVFAKIKGKREDLGGKSTRLTIRINENNYQSMHFDQIESWEYADEPADPDWNALIVQAMRNFDSGEQGVWVYFDDLDGRHYVVDERDKSARDEILFVKGTLKPTPEAKEILRRMVE